jgi:hypothetical protein
MKKHNNKAARWCSNEGITSSTPVQARALHDEDYFENMVKLICPEGRDEGLVWDYLGLADVVGPRKYEPHPDAAPQNPKGTGRRALEAKAKGKGKEKGKASPKGWWPGVAAASTGWSWASSGWGADAAEVSDAVALIPRNSLATINKAGTMMDMLNAIFIIVLTICVWYPWYKVVNFIRTVIKYMNGEMILVDSKTVAIGEVVSGDIEPREMRSIGVQSQCTYDRVVNRFKARENGFRRSGEVSFEQ